MKLLLDTHVFVWWLADDRRLRTGLRREIGTTANEVLVSSASIWEVAIKISIGKLALTGVDPARLEALVPTAGFRELPLTGRHAAAAATLPRHHGDPFDRLLIGQARLENATLVSVDPAMAAYDVQLLTR